MDSDRRKEQLSQGLSQRERKLSSRRGTSSVRFTDFDIKMRPFLLKSENRMLNRYSQRFEGKKQLSKVRHQVNVRIDERFTLLKL